MRNVAEKHADMEIMRKKILSGDRKRWLHNVSDGRASQEGPEWKRGRWGIVCEVSSHTCWHRFNVRAKWRAVGPLTRTHVHTRAHAGDRFTICLYTSVAEPSVHREGGKKRQTHIETLHDIMKIRTDWCGRFMLVFTRFVRLCTSKKKRRRLLTIDNPSSVKIFKIKSQELSICLSTHPRARERARSARHAGLINTVLHCDFVWALSPWRCFLTCL